MHYKCVVVVCGCVCRITLLEIMCAVEQGAPLFAPCVAFDVFPHHLNDNGRVRSPLYCLGQSLL